MGKTESVPNRLAYPSFSFPLLWCNEEASQHPERMTSATHVMQFPGANGGDRVVVGVDGTASHRQQGGNGNSYLHFVIAYANMRLFMRRSHEICEEQGAKDMEESKPAHLREQEQAIEESYRHGYHHGLSRARELLHRLLSEGMPPGAAMELCLVFEEDIIVPWRTHVASSSSAPPIFDVEECQRLLRADKHRQSGGPS